MSKVDFGGITREACLEYVPEAVIGDYVMVHVGFRHQPGRRRGGCTDVRILEELGQLGEIRDEVP